MAITLRSAEPADAGELGALHVACWKETYAGLVPDEVIGRLSVEARTGMWARILADPAALGVTSVLLAEDNGRAVGFGSCGVQRDRGLKESGFDAEIGALYILRSHQGVGLGRTIMRRMGDLLEASGYTSAALWVLRENRNARGFYERLGGEIVAEKEERRGDATLVEVAYGWRDLVQLGA